MKPATVDVVTAGALFGVGRTIAYRLAQRDGELCPGVPVLRIGDRYRVSVAAIEAVLGPLDDRLADSA